MRVLPGNGRLAARARRDPGARSESLARGRRQEPRCAERLSAARRESARVRADAAGLSFHGVLRHRSMVSEHRPESDTRSSIEADVARALFVLDATPVRDPLWIAGILNNLDDDEAAKVESRFATNPCPHACEPSSELARMAVAMSRTGDDRPAAVRVVRSGREELHRDELASSPACARRTGSREGHPASARPP